MSSTGYAIVRVRRADGSPVCVVAPAVLDCDEHVGFAGDDSHEAAVIRGLGCLDCFGNGSAYYAGRAVVDCCEQYTSMTAESEERVARLDDFEWRADVDQIAATAFSHLVNPPPCPEVP